MMTISSIGLATLAMAFLWRFYTVEYRDYWVDRTRQQLFEIRDSLFDAAVSGSISFSSIAYRETRDSINSLIRYTHELGYTRIVVAVLVIWAFRVSENVKEFESARQNAISQLPSEARKIAEEATRRVHGTMLRHLIFASPVVSLILAIPFIICAIGLVLITASFVGARRSLSALRAAIGSAVEYEAHAART